MTSLLTPDTLAQVLGVAESQLGTVEEPPNTNRGPKVEEYQRAAHLKPGDPWCAAFVAWVGKQVLQSAWPIPAYGGCASLGDWAKKHGHLQTTAQVGDVFLLYYPKLKRFAHTGFIVGVANGAAFRTIEGNTSGGGSREGWGVFARMRTFGPRDRFIRMTVTT